jgi:hypothetical protein
VITVFDSGPVGASEIDPVLGGAFFLTLVAGFLDEPGTADFQNNTALGEASGQRVAGVVLWCMPVCGAALCIAASP